MEQEHKIQRIVEVLKEGEKGDAAPLLGMEFEHIVVKADTLETVNYYEPQGIESLLKALQPKAVEATYEGDHLVGLTMKYGVITLEPGGQFELSISPCATLQEIEYIYLRFLSDVIPVLNGRNQLLMAIGYHPVSKIQEIPFNPKKRYAHMSEYFKKTGKYAHHMMKGTAALQVAIDYRDEADFIRKFRVANFLCPVLALISENAPVFEGEIYPNHSIRSVIWENTDPQRSGIVKGVMDQSFGYREYASYLLGVPPIFINQDHEYIPTGELTISEVLDQYQFNEEELDVLFTMVFPDVRAKRYLEIRMGDAMPYPFNMAYGALIKGIFYHPTGLDELYRLSQGVNQETLERYKQEMITKGYQAKFLGETLGSFALKLFKMAEESLGEQERHYLAPLKALVELEKTPGSLSKEEMAEMGIKGVLWCNLNDKVREEAVCGCEGFI